MLEDFLALITISASSISFAPRIISGITEIMLIKE